MPSEKVNGAQLISLIHMIRIVPVTIVFPTLLAVQMVQDLWIATLAGAVLALLIIIPLVFLGLKFPEQTVIQYSETILGNLPGKVVGLILVIYWLKIAADVIYAIGDAFTLAVMPETPIWVFTTIIAFMGAYTARHGLEVIGRISFNFMAIVVLVGIMVIVLPFEAAKVKNLLPVLENGLEPLIKPVLVNLSFWAQLVVIGMLLPHLNRIRDSVRFSGYALLITGTLIVLFSITLTVVFGVTAKDLSLPAYSLVRMIRVARFLERIEIIILISWTLAAAAKLALMLWAGSLGLVQIFGSSNYSALVYPLGIVCIIAAHLLHDNHMEYMSTLVQSAPFIVVTVAALIIILAFGWLVRRGSDSTGGI
jgi:spore germination protein KB